MSGTKEKTTGKQNVKGSAGKVSASEVAPADALNAAGSELPVTLPGHYVPVGASPVVPVMQPGGSSSLSVAESAVVNGSVTLSVENQGEENIDLTASGVSSGAETTGLNKVETMPETDDIELLEIRAVSERGFFRCGRFWPCEPVHVFVSDDPEEDNAANALEGDVVVECFISLETAMRLKAEPNLKVSVLKKVAEEE